MCVFSTARLPNGIARVCSAPLHVSRLRQLLRLIRIEGAKFPDLLAWSLGEDTELNNGSSPFHHLQALLHGLSFIPRRTF